MGRGGAETEAGEDFFARGLFEVDTEFRCQGLVGVFEGKKEKTVLGKFYGRASWGAAVLRPYMILPGCDRTARAQQ